MTKKKPAKLFPDETIVRKIYVIRGQKVMLDSDLALLYQVETNYLKRQVRRNIDRFPEDFMFELTLEEFQDLRSQFGTSSWGGRRYSPMAFTEQGVGMLSGVINSAIAVQMHIAIIRAFVEIRKVVIQTSKVSEKLKAIEERLGEHDVQLGNIYDAIENLLDKKGEEETWKNRRRIGYK